jgi:hypothetical protein
MCTRNRFVICSYFTFFLCPIEDTSRTTPTVYHFLSHNDLAAYTSLLVSKLTEIRIEVARNKNVKVYLTKMNMFLLRPLLLFVMLFYSRHGFVWVVLDVKVR